MADSKKKKTIKLEKEKETKNTVKFQEPNDGRTIRTIYIDKGTVDKLGIEDEVSVTLAAS